MKNIHKTAKIGKNVIIECNNFTLGKNSIIKDGCIIRCNNFIAGEGLYMCEGFVRRLDICKKVLIGIFKIIQWMNKYGITIH